MSDPQIIIGNVTNPLRGHNWRFISDNFISWFNEHQDKFRFYNGKGSGVFLLVNVSDRKLRQNIRIILDIPDSEEKPLEESSEKNTENISDQECVYDPPIDPVYKYFPVNFKGLDDETLIDENDESNGNFNWTLLYILYESRGKFDVEKTYWVVWLYYIQKRFKWRDMNVIRFKDLIDAQVVKPMLESELFTNGMMTSTFFKDKTYRPCSTNDKGGMCDNFTRQHTEYYLPTILIPQLVSAHGVQHQTYLYFGILSKLASVLTHLVIENSYLYCNQ